MTTVPDFDSALKTWMLAVESKRRAYWEANKFPDFMYPTVMVNNPEAPRFLRIVSQEKNGNNTLICFVDRTTGDVLKSASWKAPAKGPSAARGNIYDPARLGVNDQGSIIYLR